MGVFRPSFTSVASGLLLSAALHAPAVAWLGVRIFERAQVAVETLYEVELLAEPPPIPIQREPPVLPPDGDMEPQIERPPSGPVFQRVPERASTPLPPPAAQAGRVLTAPETDGDSGPLDFTVVQGEAEHYPGGFTSATGTSDRAVRDPRARGGVPPGPRATGTGTGVGQQRPASSKAAAARPMSASWNCAFPAAADEHQVHHARVSIVVTVRPDGSAASAAVLSNPGFDFGDAARRCALGQRFITAKDAQGHPMLATTPPFTVTFTR